MFYRNRESFDKLSIAVGTLFSKLPLTPNQWTLSSLVLAVISTAFIIKNDFVLGSVFFFLAAFIDIIDGSVARVTGRVTVLGSYLDTIVDRLVEFTIIMGLFLVDYPRGFWLATKTWLFVLLFGSMMTTYVKAAAFEKKIVEKELRGGLVERSERLILIFLIIAVSALPLGGSLLYASYLIAITAILTLVSSAQRLWIAVRSSKEKPSL